MMDNDNGQNFGRNRFDQTERSVFDEDVVERVDSVQEPYPANDIEDTDITDITDENDNDMGDNENENPDKNVREYEDTDHPHEYRSPNAVIDDYSGVSGSDRTNAFDQQNPLQSTYPSSDRDR